jgi:hypothetical protein
MSSPWPNFRTMRAAAHRAVDACGTDDAELLLATLGMAVSETINALPPDLRFLAARNWMQTLAATILPPDDEQRITH